MYNIECTDCKELLGVSSKQQLDYICEKCSLKEKYMYSIEDGTYLDMKGLFTKQEIEELKNNYPLWLKQKYGN